MRHDPRKTTHILLGAIALLLILNLADRWISGGGEGRNAPATSLMENVVTPAPAQILTQTGRIYTTSQDGETLIEWRSHNRVWKGTIYKATEVHERW